MVREPLCLRSMLISQSLKSVSSVMLHDTCHEPETFQIYRLMMSTGNNEAPHQKIMFSQYSDLQFLGEGVQPLSSTLLNFLLGEQCLAYLKW